MINFRPFPIFRPLEASNKKTMLHRASLKFILGEWCFKQDNFLNLGLLEASDQKYYFHRPPIKFDFKGDRVLY